uniref:Uncharacterized protein n=1 Tax=Rhizophora mucronata TaxID=61149 RepID=A0A2P2M300_RHIMU
MIRETNYGDFNQLNYPANVVMVFVIFSPMGSQ